MANGKWPLWLSVFRKPTDIENSGGTEMCAVFIDRSCEEPVCYYDGVSLTDGYEIRNFTAVIVVQERHTNIAIQGGRVVGFTLYDNDNEILCQYEDGRWKMKLDENDNVAAFARAHFLYDYNGRRVTSKIRAKLRYSYLMENDEEKYAIKVPDIYSRGKQAS